MTCLFCTEQIQNDAILCRFCGAVTENASWKPPVHRSNRGMHPTRKSSLTLRTAGACFLVSALFEGLALPAEVPLFGAVRGGASAVSYHLLYVGVFLAMGIGLWGARPWGYRALVAGTILCTLDTAVSLLGHHAMEADMVHWLSGYGGMVDTVTQGYLLQTDDDSASSLGPRLSVGFPALSLFSPRLL